AVVLKVAHHGSRYTAEAFLSSVRPRVAMISVGAQNSYGHPSPQVLDALATTGCQVLRTDLHGDVAVATGDSGLEVAGRGSAHRPP
ncbi:MAG: ComEC/Rec2 family competence protein, partial [Pseudonocardiaceae bacterium]